MIRKINYDGYYKEKPGHVEYYFDIVGNSIIDITDNNTKNNNPKILNFMKEINKEINKEVTNEVTNEGEK
tara:strand:- start:24 stop:233 length:210 start_codon:yes stop_codon:yes gene_type:complete